MFSIKKVKKEQKGPVLACVNYGICSKEKCHFWTTFDKTIIDQETKQPKIVQESMCVLKWIPRLMIETRNAIERVNIGVHAKSTDPN